MEYIYLYNEELCNKITENGKRILKELTETLNMVI